MVFELLDKVPVADVADAVYANAVNAKINHPTLQAKGAMTKAEIESVISV